MHLDNKLNYNNILIELLSMADFGTGIATY